MHSSKIDPVIPTPKELVKLKSVLFDDKLKEDYKKLISEKIIEAVKIRKTSVLIKKAIDEKDVEIISNILKERGWVPYVNENLDIFWSEGLTLEAEESFKKDLKIYKLLYLNEQANATFVSRCEITHKYLEDKVRNIGLNYKCTGMEFTVWKPLKDNVKVFNFKSYIKPFEYYI